MLSDVLELASIDNTIVETTKVLGRQAGLTLDTITRNQLHLGNLVYYAQNGSTAVTSRTALTENCRITVDLVKKVAASLKAANAPKIDGSYIAIIHPYAAYDIMSDDEWIDVSKYAKPENIFEGEIGKLGGVRFIENSESKIYEGGVFGTLFFGANAYGTTEITGGGLETIIKPKGSAGTADPLNQRSSIGWKGMKTAEILIPSYIWRVESMNGFSEELEAN